MKLLKYLQGIIRRLLWDQFPIRHQSDRGPACHAWTRYSVLGLESKGATCIELFKGCNTNVSLGASLQKNHLQNLIKPMENSHLRHPGRIVSVRASDEIPFYGE